MQSLRTAAFWIARTTVALSLALLAAPTVWAAGAPVAPSSGPPDYVKSYMLTILACALGIIVVGRTAHRTTEVKFFDED